MIRPLSATRIRLITDLVSTKENLIEATNEVTDSFTNVLKAQNSKRYGKPDAMRQDKRQFRSTAGLRPGLSRKEVIANVGPPTRIDRKETMSPIWYYETTDGTFRLIFQGDALMFAELLPSRK